MSMSAEIPLQRDMFTNELVDTRTAAQKRLDNKPFQYKQIEMFAQRDIAQFGVRANPTMPLTTKTALGLERQDTRTNEEKEQDLRREAASKMQPMFSSCTALVLYIPPEKSVVVYQAPTAQPESTPTVNEELLRFHALSSIGLTMCVF